MQKVPFKNFTWLDPKEVTGNVTAFPFAIDIGNKRIVSVVYLVNGRYLATSPFSTSPTTTNLSLPFLHPL